jgi:hypothetical protein
MKTPKSTTTVPPRKIPKTIVSSFIENPPFQAANDRALAIRTSAHLLGHLIIGRQNRGIYRSATDLKLQKI